MVSIKTATHALTHHIRRDPTNRPPAVSSYPGGQCHSYCERTCLQQSPTHPPTPHEGVSPPPNNPPPHPP
jgi:hypothetical protein